MFRVLEQKKRCGGARAYLDVQRRQHTDGHRGGVQAAAKLGVPAASFTSVQSYGTSWQQRNQCRCQSCEPKLQPSHS